jgi:alpha-D-xyloside xylohydrolase
MWEFGGDDSPAFHAQLKFDRLRYRLLPYVYSVAGDVTQNGSTFMRPLVMDFRDDAKARETADEYMFGPAFLVTPITTYGMRSRPVFLPATRGGWYDFWTGAVFASGQSVEVAAPYDEIPLHVRAGSIVPFGPEQQYVGEKKSDPITLFVYAGAAGTFSLYEDDGLSYGYERGEFSRIPISWDDTAKKLTIGARSGRFNGILAERTFQVVWVTPSAPVAFSFTPKIAASVHYTGEPVTVQMP